MSTLESQVKAALEAEAGRAPEAAPWSATPRTLASVGGPRSRPSWIALGGVAATAATVVGLLAFTVRDAQPVDKSATADTTLDALWTPPGEQFRLEDLGPIESSASDSVVLAALTRRIGIEDHPGLRVYTNVDYYGGRSIKEQRCLDTDGGGGGCAPTRLTGPYVGVTSSVDNGIADFDLWTWSNVPEEAAYVVYGQGAEARWQVPVFGVSAFPNVDWFDSVAVAYANDGVEVGRVDTATIEAAQLQDPAPDRLVADLDEPQWSEVRQVMDTAAIDCLTAAGADFGSGSVGQLTGEAPEGVWAGCVASAKAAVEAWIAANNIQFYEPGKDSAVETTAVIGALRVPAIGLDLEIGTGVADAAIRTQPGHDPMSATIGEPGTARIRGHRTTFGAPFLCLDALVPGDLIETVTDRGRLHFAVTETEIVETDTELPRTDNVTLVLEANHPRYTDRELIRVTSELVEPPYSELTVDDRNRACNDD